MFQLKRGLFIVSVLGAVAFTIVGCSKAQNEATGHNQAAVTSGDKPVAITANVAADIYQRTCLSCHGARAEGNPAVQAPALAGQAAEYLQRQLRNFADGLRGNHPADTQGRLMVAIVANLSPAERSELANYLSELPAPQVAAVVVDSSSDRYKKGRNYYQSYCGSCHGYNAGGNTQLHAPKLTGLDATYLARQYNNFAQGIRGQHSDDQYGRQMRAIAGGFSDPAKLDDLITYIGSIE